MTLQYRKTPTVWISPDVTINIISLFHTTKHKTPPSGDKVNESEMLLMEDHLYTGGIVNSCRMCCFTLRDISFQNCLTT